MEKVIENNNKIAYIVSSGNYHRKVYMTATCNSTRDIQTTTSQYTGTYHVGDDVNSGSVDISGTFSSTSTYNFYTDGDNFSPLRIEANPVYPFMTEQHGFEWEDDAPTGNFSMQADASISTQQTTTTKQTYTTTTNQLYVLKSYSESKVNYSISAFKTYNATKSLPATVYIKSTASLIYTYSTKSTPGSGYGSTRSGLAVITNTFSGSLTRTYSIVLGSWRQSNSPFYSSSSRSTGYTTYSYSTFTMPASMAATSLRTTSDISKWKNIIEVKAPITPDISSESATFTSLANGRTYYTTDNYISTFDAEFYGSANPDVAELFFSRTSAYSLHWTRHGYSEKRIANSKGFFVLSTSFGGFATTTSGFPKRIAIQYNSDLPVIYYSKITSETQLRRVTGTTNYNMNTITTVWEASESIVSQYTDSMTSTMDISSRTY